jgi:protein-L-isoaspartate(D-aspartate) O-methyltransferase
MVSEQLIARGLSNDKVLAAMRTVPRHNFVEAKELSEAYEDKALTISFNFSGGKVSRTLETPYVVASAAEQLVSEPPGRILEVGTGPAYQTAVLALLATEVYTLDNVEGIAQGARANLIRLDFTGNVVARDGDSAKGWAEAAPFDTIILNREELLSDAIINQLKPGGRAIIPVKADGYLYVFQKIGSQLVVQLTRSVRPTPVPGNKVDVPAVQPILRAPPSGE